MGIDIATLKTVVGEYAKPNKYMVQVFPPTKLGMKDAGKVSDITKNFTDLFGNKTNEGNYGELRSVGLNCSHATFPGISFSTHDVAQSGGVMFKMPYEKIYEPITLTFYNDIDFNSYRMFVDWIGLLKSSEHNNGNHMSFYKEYIGNIHIYQFDAMQFTSHVVTFEQLYPVSVSEIEIGYDIKDQIETFTVTFTYRSWKYEPIKRSAADIAATLKGLTNKNITTGGDLLKAVATASVPGGESTLKALDKLNDRFF